MAVVDSRQEMIREKIRIAPGNSTKTLLENFWYQNYYWVYPDFQWKNILDIGGGFGWVAPILANSAKQIIVIDPVFREPNFHLLFQEDIWRIERLIESSSSYNADISDSIQLLRARNHQEQKQVQKELLWWNDYQPKEIHSHIQRNTSYGEKLEGITDNSMDVIFLNYVISKKTVDIEGVVKEITRVLKKDGYVIVSDNDMSQDLYGQILWFFDFEEIDILEKTLPCFIGRGKLKR